MKKFVVVFLITLFVFAVGGVSLYVPPSNFQEIAYPKYREKYAYHLKNPLIERYKKLADTEPPESLVN